MKKDPVALKIIKGCFDFSVIARELRGVEVDVDERWIYLRKKKKRSVVCSETLKRFVEVRRSSLALGLYASEGSKDLTRIRFTNTNLKLHRDFVDFLRDLGLEDIIAYVYVRKDLAEDEATLDKIRQFEQMTGVKVKKVYYHERARNPIFVIDVNSVLGAIFVAHAEKWLRKMAAMGALPEEVVSMYIRGITEGDGYIRFRLGKLKNGEYTKVQGFFLQISEKNTEVADDIRKILERYYGIRLHRYGHECIGSINIRNVLTMLKHGIIPERHRSKVVKRVMMAFQRRSLPWILVRLAADYGNKVFTASEASKTLKKRYRHTMEKLRTLEREGFLKSNKCKVPASGNGTPVRRLYRLTEKALQLANLLSSLLSPPFNNISSLKSLISCVHFC